MISKWPETKEDEISFLRYINSIYSYMVIKIW